MQLMPIQCSLIPLNFSHGGLVIVAEDVSGFHLDNLVLLTLKLEAVGINLISPDANREGGINLLDVLNLLPISELHQLLFVKWLRRHSLNCLRGRCAWNVNPLCIIRHGIISDKGVINNLIDPHLIKIK